MTENELNEKALRKAAKTATRSPEQDRMALKRKVRIFYDIQRLRLQTAGRTYERPGGVSIDLHEADIAILEYRAKELERAEHLALRDVEDHLKTMPMWQVLSERPRFKGLGPTMAGVILSEFDIHKADTPSKMWSFAGLGPVPARRCRRCQAVVRSDGAGYRHPKNKCERAGVVIDGAETFESATAQRPVAGEKLNFNKWLRTKLVGVLGPCLIKAGSPWRKFYDDYKHRKESAGWGESDGHRHNAAVRYMVKMLLVDVWRDWRTLEGLAVRPSYQEEYLGHVHAQ